MPTYDYVCEACGHEFEHFQSMSDPRLEKCPKCGKKKLVRKVGAGGGVIFKGSGFYETDYKRSASKSASDSTSSASSSDAGGCGKPACAATPGTCAADAKPASDASSSSSKSSDSSKPAPKKAAKK